MGVLFVGGLLVGIVLGRFFKVLILVPACSLALLLTCVRALELDHTLLLVLAEVVVVITSLQIGYIISAVSRTSQVMTSENRKTWSRVASAAWRSVNMR